MKTNEKICKNRDKKAKPKLLGFPETFIKEVWMTLERPELLLELSHYLENPSLA